MIGFGAYFGGGGQWWIDPKNTPQPTPPTQPEPPEVKHTAASERLIHEAEQVLQELDRRAGIKGLLNELEEKLGVLRPGGNWTDPEKDATTAARSILFRIRKLLEGC